ncbi:alpha/beta-hydrolase, partial [Hanseniaspora valbyensis NRRL Y-1626]
ISIVAFSQGSAQIFASLSLYPDLNSKVISFVALSPALTPPGLFNKFVDNIVKLQPQLLFLFFGKKILLPTATTLWPKILPINLFNLAIKYSTLFLFNWENKNINKSQTVSFKNLYSPTSVKCIVHWFQILKTQNFQMFVSSDDLNENNNSIFEATPFPTRTNIKVPLLLVYGTSDSLVDIETLKKNLPEKTTFELPISKHEHLDIIWGDDVYDLVSTKVADFL